jgi:hypothetical protein
MKTQGMLALAGWFALTIPRTAAILTVGPGGTHATVQAAIDDAQATPDDDELRLRATTFFEHLELLDSDTGGRLEIAGGWDAAFAVRDPAPGATILDGSSTGRVFSGFVNAGELALRGLAFRNGLAEPPQPYGGGLQLSVVDAEVTIEDCRFDSNLATTTQGTLGAAGGGAEIGTNGAAVVHLAGLAFTDNEVFIDDVTGAALGGGFRLSAYGASHILMRHGIATGNELNGGSQRRGGGFAATTFDSATIEIEDFVVANNRGDTAGAGEALGHGADLGANDSGVLTVRRLEVTDNWTGTGDDIAQVRLLLFGGTVRLSDTLVARGGTGIDLSTTTATVRMTNLTVTGHESTGVRLFAGAPGSATLANSIAWDNDGGNAVLIGGTATGSFNLVGVDPLFVDAGAGDYRLSGLSNAIDAGTASPPGGLGPFDLAHASRVAGTLPDQGAIERHALFADDFERGDTHAWSTLVP